MRDLDKYELSTACDHLDPGNVSDSEKQRSDLFELKEPCFGGADSFTL